MPSFIALFIPWLTVVLSRGSSVTIVVGLWVVPLDNQSLFPAGDEYFVSSFTGAFWVPPSLLSCGYSGVIRQTFYISYILRDTGIAMSV